MMVIYFIFAAISYLERCDGHPKTSVPSGRIVGGKEVDPHSVGYMVALSIENGKELCGGTLISEQHILTAAHCLADKKDIEVILGAHNWKEKEDTQLRIKVNSTAYTIFYFYDPVTYELDIGIIMLPYPIRQTHAIRIVTLPSVLQKDEHYVGLKAETYGWGATSDESEELSPVLRKADVKIVNTDYCRYFYDVYWTQMCTEGNDGVAGFCGGDSGGPLMIGDLQVGIVSYSSMWCERGDLNVYTHIGTFLSWINYVIRTSKLQTL